MKRPRLSRATPAPPALHSLAHAPGAPMGHVGNPCVQISPPPQQRLVSAQRSGPRKARRAAPRYSAARYQHRNDTGSMTPLLSVTKRARAGRRGRHHLGSTVWHASSARSTLCTPAAAAGSARRARSAAPAASASAPSSAAPAASPAAGPGSPAARRARHARAAAAAQAAACFA